MYSYDPNFLGKKLTKNYMAHRDKVTQMLLARAELGFELWHAGVSLNFQSLAILHGIGNFFLYLQSG